MMPRAAVLLSFCLVATAHSPAVAGNMTYHIEPTSLDGWLLSYSEGDWLLASGTITTDGTIGELQADNIIDYDIRIDGPVPRSFTSTQDHRLNVAGVVATANDLLMLPAEMGRWHRLNIYEANPTQRCPDCERWIGWGPLVDGETSFVYEIYDQDSYGVPDASIAGFVNSIATVVPEPASLSMAGLAMLGFLSIVRSKRVFTTGNQTLFSGSISCGRHNTQSF